MSTVDYYDEINIEVELTNDIMTTFNQKGKLTTSTHSTSEWLVSEKTFGV